MKKDPVPVDLDLRGSICPMAFVRLRLFADKMSDGDRFTVLYENTPANEPLVRSIEAIGHTIRTLNKPETDAIATRIIEVQINGNPD